ncbi:subtilisin-like serine-protease S [Malania oleifera]|uniref:subtilisin-like serine-protease S n=1 Tax=Malania oleifera TaxID=397392 RepID=UPI0025AECA8B|nr:subtilisin-like serine-protease S [Malania oleifera]
MIKCIRTDNDGEYCGPFDVYYRQQAIQHQRTPPKTPQLNALAERINRTLEERVRCLLSEAKLPRSFWGKALYTVAHVINLSPTVVLQIDAVDRIWYVKDVSYDHLRVFGSKAFVHVPKDDRFKLGKAVHYYWEKYIEKVLQQFYMEKTKVVSTLLATHFKLSSKQSPSNGEEKRDMESVPYASAVGSLMYAMVYAVYMGGRTTDDAREILRQNHQMLIAVHGGSIERARASHVYSYTHGFRGFAAKLTEQQASEIAEMPGVVSVFPNSKRRLHTTHSWNYMGLEDNESMEIPGHSTENQHNVIIGFIDTGIWPESPSFADRDMPAVPARWKGQCQPGEAFKTSACNRKIVGARYYLSGFEAEEGPIQKIKFKSPRDNQGHGTHTASTAAGRQVTNVNYEGLGSGDARGGAPMARIAVYKSCWDSGCYDADILAAFDDAIKDGVDILSLSLGSGLPQENYFSDSISVGSFHATTHGIVVVSSVGNEGSKGSATNLAPWMITVAAGSTDRDFMSEIMLGDGANFTGESLVPSGMKASAEIIPASEAHAENFTPDQSRFCLESFLSSAKATGKVVVCHNGDETDKRVEQSKVVKEAGGVGMILVDEAYTGVGFSFLIPGASVGRTTGNKILSYINETRKPTSRILGAKTLFRVQRAPRVAAFSSEGPNSVSPEILKPDITAPGLNILAACPPTVRGTNFCIMSGTSMACPHVTGIVALIKSVYPSWSPSAIKSAIMTTARVVGDNGKPIIVDPGRYATPFDYGSGFMNPLRVLDPGLIYDARQQDYIEFLCSIGYNKSLLHLITGGRSTCDHTPETPYSLNYPSIIVPHLKDGFSVTRTLTNVRNSTSTYEAAVASPAGISATVVPQHLIFDGYGQKMNFTVNFKVVAPSNRYTFGSLSWMNGKFSVTIPLIVKVSSSNLG